MAHGAGLILLGLIVEGRSRGRSRVRGKGVTLQTEQVHLRALEQARVGIAVRGMARDAALGFHRRVLEDERSRFVAMALEARSVLRCRDAELAALEPAMRIVAVAALHEAFVDAVMKRARELLLGFQMAAVTQLRRLLFHQELAFPGVMRTVAIVASDVVLQMRRAREIAVFLAGLVAIEAARAGLCRRNALETENFGLIATALDVGLAWAVAGLAAMPFGAPLRVQRGHKVRRSLEIFVEALRGHIFMAGLAGFGAYI